MIRKTCPYCKARSYSSDGGSDWDCPICGKNLSEVPNDHDVWGQLLRVLEDDRVQERLTVRRVDII